MCARSPDPLHQPEYRGKGLDGVRSGRRKTVSKLEMSNSNGDSVSYYAIITDRKRRRKDKPFDEPEDKFTAFATNTSWINVLKYGKRWSIETGDMIRN